MQIIITSKGVQKSTLS